MGLLPRSRSRSVSALVLLSGGFKQKREHIPPPPLFFSVRLLPALVDALLAVLLKISESAAVVGGEGIFDSIASAVAAASSASGTRSLRNVNEGMTAWPLPFPNATALSEPSIVSKI